MEIKEMAEIIEKFRKFIEEKKIDGATVRRVSMNARGDPSQTMWYPFLVFSIFFGIPSLKSNPAFKTLTSSYQSLVSKSIVTLILTT